MSELIFQKTDDKKCSLKLNSNTFVPNEKFINLTIK
jgi:hypothetical protein